MHEREIPVLIVGGSLVGLTTSLLLSSRGVANMVVERHRGTAIHPRAASFQQRTMEIFRGAGLQAEIEAAAAREFVQGGAIVAVESLCGRELKYFYKSYNDGVEGLSPTSRLFITQVGLEPVIRERAAALGADTTSVRSWSASSRTPTGCTPSSGRATAARSSLCTLDATLRRVLCRNG